MTPHSAAVALDDECEPAGMDAEALGRMFQAHHRFVGAIARNVLGPDDADDGVQEVFLRLSTRRATYDGRSAFRTWLYRVTVNTCINMAKARTRRWKGKELLNVGESCPTQEVPIEWIIDLRAALDALPPLQRRLVLMHDLHGYRHAEVGRALGLKEGTSKARLFRARRSLRRSLDGY